MDISALLQQVKDGTLSIREAEEALKKLPYEDIGFAKLDHHRSLRSGFGEVVYCAGKTCDQVSAIMERFAQRGSNVLGTRATPQQYEAAKQLLPEIQYDEISGVLSYTLAPVKQIGLVTVCTGGTSDMAVAEEAAKTAEFFGARVERIYDVGVAGIHRLFARLEDIRRANCVIAVAGMEGALAGVLAGLIETPVVAVPTSIGYGANFGGLSALLTMLNSCAEGIGVVNIDNGFGAGYLATQINRMAERGHSTQT